MTVTLDAIRPCLEGAVPAVIATCARDGTPNVSYISEVHYVDATHVALSFQFFSKTRQNVLENPRATVVVVHPDNGAQYKLAVHYLRTEESGALFESMKAKLAGIASHTGMTGVFKLRGADVYRVESIVQVYGTPMTASLPRLNTLSAVRNGVARLAGATDLESLLDGALAVMREQFRFSHAMVLMHDPVVGKLYAVASAGYPQSGVGAEIALGRRGDRRRRAGAHTDPDHARDRGIRLRARGARGGREPRHGCAAGATKSRSRGSPLRRARSRCRSWRATG